MLKRFHKPGNWLALFLFLFLMAPARKAWAVPSYDQLQPANNYGTVTPSLLSSAGGKYTYGFAVTNTQAAGGFGIKGVLVYGAIAPIAIAGPSRCGNTLYQATGKYSWWDHQGGPDNNNNGLCDNYIEPGESFPGTTFTLTYDRQIDLTTLKFGFHVVEPYTGKTWFARTNGDTPNGPCVEITATGPECVASGSTAKLCYTVKNIGTTTLKCISVKDDWGYLSGEPATLAPGASFELCRTVCIQTSYDVINNDVCVTAQDTACKTCSDTTVQQIHVVHPSISICASAEKSCITSPPGESKVTYCITNTGDADLTGVVVKAKLNNGSPITVKTIALLKACDKVCFTYTFTGITDDSRISFYVTGLEECSDTVVDDCTSECINVVHPSITIDCTTGTPSCIKGGTGCVKVYYEVKNTGDVNLTNVKVYGIVNGGAPTVIKTIGTLCKGAIYKFSYTYCNINVDATITAVVKGYDCCSGTWVEYSHDCQVDVVNPKLALVGTDLCTTPGGNLSVVFTVQNTGDVAVNSLQAVSSATTTGAASVTPGAFGSTTVGIGGTTSISVALNNVATTGTVTLSIAGLDSSLNSNVGATGVANVTVVHPALELIFKSVSPVKPTPGQTFTLSGTINNTGDVNLTSVVISLSGDAGNTTVNVGNLTVGSGVQNWTAQLTVPANFPAGQQVNIGGDAEGTAQGNCGKGVTSEGFQFLTDAPRFNVTGRALCGPPPPCNEPTLVNFYDSPVEPEAGVTVKLMQGVIEIASTTTNANGEFSFLSQPAGTYTVQIQVAEHYLFTSSTFTIGPDKALGDLLITPYEVCYVAAQVLCGEIYFSSVPGYQALQGGTVDTDDTPNAVYNGAYANGATYKYNGYIPGHPSLGHYGDVGEPEIWMFMKAPLVAETSYQGCSLTNLVGVEKTTGPADINGRRPFMVRALLSQPFIGPGTATEYQVLNTEVKQNGTTLFYPSTTPLTTIKTDGSAGDAQPAGVVPPGYMARTVLNFEMVRGGYEFYANGTYEGECHDVYTYRIHPEGVAP